jgi:hypothetical protein
MHFDDFRAFQRGLRRLDPRRHEQMQHLGKDARRRQDAVETLPVPSAHARFLDELALRGGERRLVGFELPRGQLPDPTFSDVPILPQEAHLILGIDRHHRGAAWMMHDLQLRAMAVREHGLVRGHLDDPAVEMNSLLFRLHVSKDGTLGAWLTNDQVGSAEVRQARLILISGLPGTGKSTLARVLAQRYALPLICKDTIKEPLFDLIGAVDRAASRRLSDASFAAMFALARDCLRAGSDLILEGNFRPGEHEAALIAALPAAAPSTAAISSRAADPAPHTATTAQVAHPALHAAPGSTANIAQILCVASEPVRIARLNARATDLSRHPGHRDAIVVQDPSPPLGDFLALPGPRLVLDGDGLSPADTHDRRVLELLHALDQWRREP